MTASLHGQYLYIEEFRHEIYWIRSTALVWDSEWFQHQRVSSSHLVVPSVKTWSIALGFWCYSSHLLLWHDSSTWLKKHKFLEHGSKLERTLQRLDNVWISFMYWLILSCRSCSSCVNDTVLLLLTGQGESVTTWLCCFFVETRCTPFCARNTMIFMMTFLWSSGRGRPGGII